MSKKFNRALKRLIIRDGIRPADLARSTGVPPTSLSRFINNETSNPQLETLLALSKAFGVTVGQMAGEESIPGLDEDIRGQLVLPYPKSPKTMRLQQAISQADAQDALNPDVIDALFSIIEHLSEQHP